jgi:hypothetical protein
MMEELLFAGVPLLVILAVRFAPKIFSVARRWLLRLIMAARAIYSIVGVTKDTDIASLNESLEVVGYAYDPDQDIFFSLPDPWQKEFGYCRLYDEAAASMGMIIDCEPVYFEYAGKKWLIEFWKGQYGMTTGCEIGIYSTEASELDIPGVFNGTFYYCPDSTGYLDMSYSLKKHRKTLFARKDRHWWLTGFRLGEFSEPSELSMYIIITLKDRNMRDAFVKGLQNAGYSQDEYLAYGNSVVLVFDKPHTPQPTTRTQETDAVILQTNKLLCDQYRKITRDYTTMQEKIQAIREKVPELYKYIIWLGKPKQLYSMYETVKDYLD